MGKAVEGVALVAGAVVGEVVAPELSALWLSVGMTGASMVVEGIAQALEGSQGNFSIRQAAAPCQAIYGMTRTGGTIVWASTTGSNLDYLHVVVVWACHPCESIESLYIDGKQVFLDGNSTSGGALTGDNAVLNMQGQPTAGNALSGNYQDINGNTYSWGGSVCVYNHLGGNTSVNPFLDFLSPNDPNYPAASYFNGLTATYIKFTYNANRFNGGIPNIRAVIRGKNDIYDPRNGTTGYSQNMALCISNLMCDTNFGVGCVYASEIDETQLIAAANACDEQVDLAAGGTESRYECNGTFQTNSSPGDIVQSMMDSCAGRLTYTSGVYGIFPGVWLGDSGAAIQPGTLVATPSYTATRKYRDLVNLCQGTFICPTYPFSSGYSFDYQDPELEVFNGCFQPTNFPYWTNDTFHGYASDVSYITADKNRTLTKDIKLQFVLSVATAQRIAKINIMRNRFQASGTFPCNLSMWNTTAMDNIEVTFPYLELDATEFEVQTFKFNVQADPGQPENAPALSTELTLAATDSSIYDWSTSEEVGLTLTQSPTINDAFQIAGPTGLSLTSGSGTAFTNEAGVVTGRIAASWTAPADTFIVNSGNIEVQRQESGASPWNSSGALQGSITSYLLGPCIGNQQYNVRVRGYRSNGVTSEWVAVDNYTVQLVASTIDSDDVYYSDTGLPLTGLEPKLPGADPTATSTPIKVANPGFEQVIGGNVQDWTFQAGWSALNSASAAHSGNWCAKFSGGADAGVVSLNDVLVKPGQVMLAQCMINAASAVGSGGYCQVGIQWLTSTLEAVGSASLGNEITVGTADYQISHVVGTAPVGAAVAWVFAYAVNITGGSTYVDDFSADFQSSSMDEVPDGTTYARTLATQLTSNQIDFSKSYLNKGVLATANDLDEVPDGTSFARVASSQLTSNSIDFSKSYLNKGALATVNTVANTNLTGGGVYGQGGESAGPTVMTSGTTQDLPLNHLWNAGFVGNQGENVGASGDGQPAAPSTLGGVANPFTLWTAWNIGGSPPNLPFWGGNGAGVVALPPAVAGGLTGIIQTVSTQFSGAGCPFTLSVQVAWQTSEYPAPNGEFGMVLYGVDSSGTVFQIATQTFAPTGFSATALATCVLYGTISATNPANGKATNQVQALFYSAADGSNANSGYALSAPMLTPQSSLSAFTSNCTQQPIQGLPGNSFPPISTPGGAAGNVIVGEPYA